MSVDAAPIRVLVVDDSATVRRRLCEVLERSPGFEVVGEAENGSRAIELCDSERPDVVTMDMIMPVMSGLAATEYIMAHFPTPILVVSASLNRGELFRTYDALAAGAVDVLEKPRGTEADDAWEKTFLSAVRLVSRIPVIRHPRGRLARRPDGPAEPPVAGREPRPFGRADDARVIAIGASTGGPAAILEVIRALPADLGVPVLLVLHINEPFGASFAEWLESSTGWRVGYPDDGDRVESWSGRVAMAPPGFHLAVAGDRFRRTLGPERHSCRPSVDVLFESLARSYGPGTAACLLTGMGRDGAAGLLAVRQAGGATIAQDQETSVVWGMPREAVEIGGAASVLPLGEIGPALAALVRRMGRGDR